MLLYSKKKIIVYNESKISKEKLILDYKPFAISIENAKPYLQTSVIIESASIDAKCLIDTGNSDPVWLFENKTSNIDVPDKNFNDFLGIKQFSINGFEFKKPISSFPDSVSLKNVKMVKDRLGSVGGELLKRFTIIFDYQDEKIYLKKNHNYNQPFKYNISGISIHHTGLQWISEYTPLRAELNISSSDKTNYSQSTSELKYRFLLKPLYEISNIRKNSLAEKAGLQEGDIIISINNKSAYRLSLQEMNGLLKADAGEYISINIRRNNKELNFRFRLEELL